ncbi:MAG: CE1 family esterase, partial [Planctomycetota bacterium]
MKTTMLLVAAALLILNPLDASGAELTSLAPGTNEVRIEHDGHTRRLIVTTPKTYDRQRAYPILLCFHGAGGRADGQSERWGPQADKNGFVVISAEAIQSLKKWNFKDDFHEIDHDDVGFVTKVVKILITNKIADKNAVFATGHSSGGLFSWRLVKETDLFAAAAPMSC